MHTIIIITLIQLFLWTAAKHALFMSNNYLIHMLKFEIGPFRVLNLANDMAAFLCCFPNYFILAYPSLVSLVSNNSATNGAVVAVDKTNIESEKEKETRVEHYLKE